MSCIIKQKRKGSQNWYAYESTSYWIPGVGPRTKRKYLGRVDPVTGEIIPSKKRKATGIGSDQDSTDTGTIVSNGLETPRPNSSAEIMTARSPQALPEDLSNEIKALRSEVQRLQTQMENFSLSLKKARDEIISRLNTCISAEQIINNSSTDDSGDRK